MPTSWSSISRRIASGSGVGSNVARGRPAAVGLGHHDVAPASSRRAAEPGADEALRAGHQHRHAGVATGGTHLRQTTRPCSPGAARGSRRIWPDDALVLDVGGWGQPVAARGLGDRPDAVRDAAASTARDERATSASAPRPGSGATSAPTTPGRSPTTSSTSRSARTRSRTSATPCACARSSPAWRARATSRSRRASRSRARWTPSRESAGPTTAGWSTSTRRSAHRVRLQARRRLH